MKDLSILIKINRTKIDEKSKKCTFIGYGVNDFGYHLWDYENKKIIMSRDVVGNTKTTERGGESVVCELKQIYTF